MKKWLSLESISFRRIGYIGTGALLASFSLCGCSIDTNPESLRMDGSTKEAKPANDAGNISVDDACGEDVDATTAETTPVNDEECRDDDAIPVRDAGSIDGNSTEDAGPNMVCTHKDVSNIDVDLCKTIDKKILVLYGGAINDSHTYYQNALGVLGTHRLSYETKAVNDKIDYVENGVGKYSVIVLTDYDAYESLDQEKRQAIDEYNGGCNVGVFFLYVSGDRTLAGNNIATSSRFALSDQRIDDVSDIPSIARNGGILPGFLQGTGRLFKTAPSCGYFPVALVKSGNEIGANIISDDGSYDGIKRIFNGHDFVGFWYHELLFLDGLQWLSPVDLGILRDRWINFDIDDVFQANWNDDPAQRIVKIQKEDVDALLATQRYVSSMMEGHFRFTLGFNSGFYKLQVAPAPFDDAAGDSALVANRAEFYWFDHLPNHEAVYNYNKEQLVSLMQKSREWAITNGVIDYMLHYAVSPSHDGINSRYDPLYQAWRDVWGIGHASATHNDVGFEYSGIRVAPRQGLGGIGSGTFNLGEAKKSSIDQAIAGGNYYRQVISNPVAIFMTHQANFARDRILLYIVEHLIEFLHTWTNFRLIAVSPDEAVEKSFELFPPVPQKLSQ